MCFSEVSQLQFVSEYKNAKLSVILYMRSSLSLSLGYRIGGKKPQNIMHPYPNRKCIFFVGIQDLFSHVCQPKQRLWSFFPLKLTKLFSVRDMQEMYIATVSPGDRVIKQLVF